MEVNKLTAYDKIDKCIKSCKRLVQLRNCSIMIQRYEYIYKDKLYVDKLTETYYSKRKDIYKSMNLKVN